MNIITSQSRMTTLAIAEQGTTLSTELSAVADKASAAVRDSLSSSTHRARKSDWHCFAKWCAKHDRESIPADPGTVALYLTDLADSLRISSLERRKASISKAHELAGHESPVRHPAVKEVWRGLKRQKGTAPDKSAPVTVEALKLLVSTCGDDLKGKRDRALLLLGFSGCFRRSELVAIEMADLSFVDEGLEVLVRKSKTDQEGKGLKKRIPYGSNLDTCPIRSLKIWMDAADIEDGKVFRAITRHGAVNGSLSSQSVALIVKARAEQAGLAPELFSGHSLRSGFATSAAKAGASTAELMQQGGWRTERIAISYVQDRDAWKHNPASKVGL